MGLELWDVVRNTSSLLEIVNFYDENLSPQIETGEYVPEPIQLDDEPHSEEEVSAFVNGVVDAISTDLWVSLSDTTEPTIVLVMTDDISDGLVPVTVPVNASDSGVIFLGGICDRTVTNTDPVASSDTLVVAENSMRCWWMCWRMHTDARMGTHSRSRPYLTRQWQWPPRTGSQISFTPDPRAFGSESPPITSTTVTAAQSRGP